MLSALETSVTIGHIRWGTSRNMLISTIFGSTIRNRNVFGVCR